jgi:hypothetical protein
MWWNDFSLHIVPPKRDLACKLFYSATFQALESERIPLAHAKLARTLSVSAQSTPSRDGLPLRKQPGLGLLPLLPPMGQSRLAFFLPWT